MQRMITANTPPTVPDPSQVPPAIVEQLSASEGAAAFGDHEMGDFIKKLILRHLINGAIRQNEAQHVTSGVQITDLKSGQTIVGHNLDTQHFAASINKLPVVLLVLQDLRAGRLSLNQTMTWQASDVRAGNGVFDQPGAPLQASLGDVIFDLLNRSGNTAVRILVNQGLGGAAAVNNRWAQIPQLSNTRLQPLDANRFFLGNSTPRDSLWTMTELMKTQDQYATFLKNALKSNIFTDMGVRSQLAGNDYIVLVNKVGILDDVDGNNRHDVGIIYNTRTHKSYGYSFMTTSPFDDPAATPRAGQSLKDMGRYLLRFSGDKRHQAASELAPKANSELQAEGRILY
jgi:beta-lactamase class A